MGNASFVVTVGETTCEFNMDMGIHFRESLQRIAIQKKNRYIFLLHCCSQKTFKRPLIVFSDRKEYDGTYVPKVDRSAATWKNVG